MQRKMKFWWLLLVLGCLVRCACAEEPTPTNSTTAAPAPPTTIAATRPATTRPATTLPPAPSATEKKQTTAPPTITAFTTKSQTSPPTAVKSTTTFPVATTQKSSTPSSGGHVVQQSSITTVSKTDRGPSQMPPKSSVQSTAPQVSTATTGPGVSYTQSLTPGKPTAQNPTTAGSSQTPAPSGATTQANQGIRVSVPVTNAPVAATVTKEAETELKRDVTTKQDINAVTGTTAAATSKPSPERDQGLLGSTVPPETPPPETSSKAPTAVTPEKPDPEPVHLSTAESRVQIRVQTSAPPSTSAPSTGPESRIFTYSLNRGPQLEPEKDLISLCRQLMGNLEDGNCTLSLRYHHGTVQFDSAEISGKVKAVIVAQQFEDITKKPTDNRTLITILASCGALLIMIIILAVCASHHRKPYNENQQHLTDEMQTVENGYHDNPTLEVMEVQAVEPEKKLNLNGEFNDSWIVPMDNLLKEEGPDEEDTHL